MEQKIIRLVCIVLILLCIIAAALLISGVAGDRQSQLDFAETFGIEEGMSEEDKEERMALAAGEAARFVTMQSEVSLRDGEIPLRFSNSEENKCSVSLEVVLMGTNDIIAQSGLIEPGWYVESLSLERELENGEHYCIVRCAFYTTEGNVFVGQTSRQMLLTVG